MLIVSLDGVSYVVGGVEVDGSYNSVWVIKYGVCKFWMLILMVSLLSYQNSQFNS